MDEAARDLAFRPTLRIGGAGIESHQFRKTLRGIAVDGEGRIYAVGDAEVKVYEADGELARSWPTSLEGHSVAVSQDGRVWVGQWQQVEIFDDAGQRLDAWSAPGRLGLVTAIGFGPEDVYLADATARWIHRYDAAGKLRNEIGDQHRKGGFHIPNGVVDFAVDDQGIVHVANPGMHRVERYAPDGTLLGHFGRFDGRDPAGFPGCCNPTNLTVDAAGRVFVSEKAGPRVKVYDSAGQLLAVIADRGFDPAAKNMDVAVDGEGRFYVADPVRLEIRVFVPAGGREPA